VGTSGIACLDATNIDDETSAVMRVISRYESGGGQGGYYTLTGGRTYPTTTTIHPGVIDVNLFRTTPTGQSDAYGRYQMLSTTWNGWASRAGVPLAQQGTNSKGERYFNMSPQYQDAAVASTLRQNRVNTCASFFASARAGGYASNQWAAFKSGTTGLSQGESLCQQLLADEKTGSCKQ
jgi:muramidase (phage lysozyme)